MSVGGFNATKFSSTRAPSQTVLFLDASLVKAPWAWHPANQGNVGLADGHVAFLPWPDSSDGADYTWIP